MTHLDIRGGSLITSFLIAASKPTSVAIPARLESFTVARSWHRSTCLPHILTSLTRQSCMQCAPLRRAGHHKSSSLPRNQSGGTALPSSMLPRRAAISIAPCRVVPRFSQSSRRASFSHGGFTPRVVGLKCGFSQASSVELRSLSE